MALKRKLTVAEFDALADTLKAEYIKDGAGYVLDVDDAKELKNSLENEKTRRKELDDKFKALEAEKAKLAEEHARKNGDVAALDESYKTKMAALEKQLEAATAALTVERNDRYVSVEADRMAKMFTVPELIRDRIAKRLSVEVHDNKPLLRVLDKDGKPSALSINDLEKEFVDNPDYKSIVVASRASGTAEQTPQPPADPLSFDQKQSAADAALLARVEARTKAKGS